MNNFLHEYWELLTDGPHIMLELTFLLVVDIILLGLVWPLIRRMTRRLIKKEHRIIDQEHGIDHSENVAILSTPVPGRNGGSVYNRDKVRKGNDLNLRGYIDNRWEDI